MSHDKSMSHDKNKNMNDNKNMNIDHNKNKITKYYKNTNHNKNDHHSIRRSELDEKKLVTDRLERMEYTNKRTMYICTYDLVLK